MLQYHSQSKKQGYINEQARPCFFFMSTVLSRHSERHEHTGENEQPNRKRKRGETTPFDEKKFFDRPASLPQTPNKNGCSKIKTERS
ncbi:hypothetical protein EE55_15715 [Enterococcus faecalis]|nr:hypothetical protein EE55_15715 [Enterococcus faecalis]